MDTTSNLLSVLNKAVRYVPSRIKDGDDVLQYMYDKLGWVKLAMDKYFQEYPERKHLFIKKQ